MTTLYPTRILLATDGSEDATLAAQFALEIAYKTGSELHVVYVEYLPPVVDYEMKRITEAVIEDKRKRAEGFLDAQTELIGDAGGRVTEAHLRMGSPDKEIVALAEEVGTGLIVLGSRGLGGVRRMLMGSVSDSVVRHAYCPVLVVREEKDVRQHSEDPVSATRLSREETREKPSFWQRLFDNTYYSGRQAKVLEYIIHRINDGAHLRDVMQEEYVRRLASPDEVEQILDNPRLVEAARKKLEEDFSSGKLGPN